MADLLELKEGVLPWEPPYSEGTMVLNSWGIPLSGLVRRYGRTFFLLCLGGEASSANIWGYVPLDQGEEDEILRDHTHEAFERLIRTGRTWLAALSIENQELVQWASVEDKKHDEPALRAALRSLHMSDEDLDRLVATA